MGIKRKTKSVQALLDIFDQSDNAWSVVDLVEKLSSEMNKTTVYRILDRFQDEGLLHSFTDTNGLKWYAQCVDCSQHNHDDVHPHFQCKTCGKVECLSAEIPLPSFPSYQVDNAEILLTGQCSDCK